MSYATDMVDRRVSTRDRRLFGDRRSNVIPNLSDHSRRIAVQDRRHRAVDRRMLKRSGSKSIDLVKPVWAI